MNEGTIVNAGALITALLTIALLLGIWRARRRRFVAFLLFIPALLFGIAASLFFWYGHRPQPAPAQEALFPGIEYTRAVRSTPRPLVLHLIRIDLATPGLEFVVTPGTPGEDLPARTVSEFLTEFDLQLAINGAYFQPWWDRAPWDYYPHSGDPVHPVFGIAAARGTVYAVDETGTMSEALFISADNQVSFRTPVGDTYNAIGGLTMLLSSGTNVIDVLNVEDESLHPRTAVGLDESGQTLILMVIDGRQPGYSEGVSLRELAELMRDFGAYQALNLDGGGSSTLVAEGSDGQPSILNSPIHSRIPGQQRPVATHLGVSIRAAGN